MFFIYNYKLFYFDWYIWEIDISYICLVLSNCYELFQDLYCNVYLCKYLLINQELIIFFLIDILGFEYIFFFMYKIEGENFSYSFIVLFYI